MSTQGNVRNSQSATSFFVERTLLTSLQLYEKRESGKFLLYISVANFNCRMQTVYTIKKLA